jgi:co-chaperonin GroES (HSP10)
MSDSLLVENIRRDSSLPQNPNVPSVYTITGSSESKHYLTLEEKIADCFLEPGPGRVIVLPDTFVYHGKLIIPDNAKRAGTTATVLKVGVGCIAQFGASDGSNDKDFLKPGSRVVYGTWTGTQVNFDQRPAYRILHESEIVAVITGEATKLDSVEA